MARIDPGLRRIARASARRHPRELAAVLRHTDVSDTPNVMVELEGAAIPQALLDLGFVARTHAGSVVTGQIPRDAIPALETVPGLRRAEAPRGLRRDLDLALPDAQVVSVHGGTPPRQGKGVIVGIIDHGIDYQHVAFRKADGSTRILALWDQSLVPVDGESAPLPFGYGVHYTREQIDAALRSPAAHAFVRHQDEAPYHGTHVAAIAAGSSHPGPIGSGLGVLTGVAPDADLVIVANTRSRHEDPGSVGDSADTLDAVAYILQIAAATDGGRPVAINLSQGDNVGPHDGTSLLEVGIANLMTAPGRVLVKSAGNEGTGGSHATGVLVSGVTQDVTISVPPDQSELVIDFWYSRGENLAIGITPPGAPPTSKRIVAPFTGTVALGQGVEVSVDADLDDPGNGDNRTYIAAQPVAAGDAVRDGTWTFHLEGTGVWHAWIQCTSMAAFRAPFASRAGTISIPGTTSAVITAGAYVTRSALGRVGKLSDTSGRGPTRDGRSAPTLAAPGHKIAAAQPGNHAIKMGGTSMATAMVTGAAALLLSIDETLTVHDIRDCLERTARADAHTGAVPNANWGAGKLDVAAACNEVETARRAVTRNTARTPQG